MPVCRRVTALTMLILGVFPLSNANAALPSTSATLTWTAPGDDGSIGRATRYDLRYSSLPITSINFTQAKAATGVPLPKTAGSPESFTVTGLASDSAYYLAVKAVDDAGNWSLISNVAIRPAQTAGFGREALAVSFSTPWPNPSRDVARFAYQLPLAAAMQVDAFDISGRHVRTIASGWHDAGAGELAWDLRNDAGSRVAPGVYMVHAKFAGQDWVRRTIVIS